jgi:ferredoxin
VVSVLKTVGAIISLEETDKEKCIGCMRCVAVCPENARKLNRVIVNAVTEKLKMVCSEPKENTLYI